MKSDLVDISVIVMRRTEKAVLVDHGGKKAEWVPLSQCEVEPDGNGRTHTLTCQEWLAVEKGMV